MKVASVKSRAGSNLPRQSEFQKRQVQGLVKEFYPTSYYSHLASIKPGVPEEGGVNREFEACKQFIETVLR